MITQDGWLDWATRVPGPADKVNGGVNRAVGYVPHSAVGFYTGWASRLFSDERGPDGHYSDNAAVSVHGWITYDGTVIQHYPFTACCWSSGSPHPNNNFIAFENEGGFQPTNEPLTPAQVAANVKIIRELASWRGWSGFRRPTDESDVAANMYEHRECRRWGSAATACPSDRIPWQQLLQELQAGGESPATIPVVGRTVLLRHADGTTSTMDVDEYAKGVLPYEMGTGWPTEALKAQAVVAKSYALAAGAVYTDTRSQVYGPQRHPDTDAAVEAVRGQYLAFQGEVVMPFYFGHCNGQTRTPSQAGWSPIADRPFLQPVPCECGRSSYFGHGIGMCQRGAQAMALRGASYQDILRHYYRVAEVPGAGEAGTTTPPPANALTYVVQPGDSLLTIAARFHVAWPAIYMANRDIIADPNVIPVGARLVIPRGPSEEGAADLHVVQPGDTLFSLARAWGTSVAAIVAANQIADENVIRVGQRLRRP
jgi:LysM repeat protein